MTMAIYEKTGVGTTKLDKFEQSFAMARSQLTKWGYLSNGSEQGPISNIKLTAKGFTRTSKHSGDNASATAAFNRLFSELQEKNKQQALEAEGPKKEKPSKGATAKLPKLRKPTIKKLSPKKQPMADRKFVSKAKKPMAKKASRAKSAKRAARA